ncbi:hypothetical protein [Sorangium sp. So ce1389]|uniref:hypothetical protein n=1 Tax=Sorangium sp. So ce1389 TaxID=3133336 RepID=UPI003F641803
MDAAAEERLQQYIDGIGTVLGHPKRREAFASYTLGLLSDLEPLWLLIEWPFGESDPSKFAVTTLGTKMSKKQIVRQYKERYRTEQAYEEMKGELGLDHFEGRRFRGWHHHVSVVLCCYAFIVAERDRSFFPSADAEGHAHPLRFAA